MAKDVVIQDEELGVNWEDAGPWRSFRLDTEGDCLIKLLEDAYISAVDQDGGEMYTDKLYDDNLCVDSAERLIAIRFLESRGYEVTRKKS